MKTIGLTLAIIVVIAVLNFMPIVQEVKADLPVHCLWNETRGVWNYQLGEPKYTKEQALKACAPNQNFTATSQVTYDLEYPNIVKDKSGNKAGTWTIIWDQSAEVNADGKRYHAFFYYTTENGKAVSHCGQTFTGYYYTDKGPNTQSGYGCFRGEKPDAKKLRKAIDLEKFNTNIAAPVRMNSEDIVKSVNEDKTSTWTATVYPEFEGMTMEELQQKGYGGKRMRRWRRHAIDQAMKEFRRENAKAMQAQKAKDTPVSWDWRDVNGKSYVSPVLNQGSCGSCYIFGTLGQAACRLRTRTNNADQTTFSQQDVLNCGDPVYAQGCEGGMQYTIAKYGYELGFLPAKCLPYKARGEQCPSYSNRWGCDQKPYYVKNFGYVGGYYGGTTEQKMRESLVEKGALTVAFYVKSSFFHYRGGIYQDSNCGSTIEDPHIPFVDVNHSVLIVGYGEKDGVPYWIARNSWGASWGVSGYFMIKRGSDECGIESCVVEFEI